ncbi:MAG: ABC transporter permease, partial [Propionicimonas sp.]|nr:ABC transporter permease [Propionicimonas sp.]
MKRVQLATGITLVCLVLLAAVVSVFWTPFDPIRVVPQDRLLGPGWPHLLGTDGFGIDIASQLLVGARMCLVVGIISVSLAAIFGVPLGMLAGQRGDYAQQIRY